MPETDDTTPVTTTPDTDTPPVVEAPPAAYVFPFPVADLSTATDDELRALHTQVREHGASFAGQSPAATSADTIIALTACRDLAVEIANELGDRADRADAADSLLSDLALANIVDLTGDPDPEPDPEPVVEPASPVAAVTAARRAVPRVRDVARGTTAPPLPQDAQRPAYASMTAAADSGRYTSGQALATFNDAALVLNANLALYPSQTAQRARTVAGRRPVTVYDADSPGRQLEMRTFTRRAGVELRRHFPTDLRVVDAPADDQQQGYAIAMHAASEKRLPGGNLRESARLAVKAGRSLTAAAGWCAPSETIYDLVETETLDGILDTPEMQTTRGGWNIPINGGPDFASIYNAIGNAGVTHLSEAQVMADVAKVATDIPCPTFEEVVLGVDYFILTGGLLQRRGYPEVVARFSRAAVIALAHKINMGYIAAIVAGSGAATVITTDPSGDDAASALLALVDLAIVDAKYRNRASFIGTMEVVMPWWVLVPIRAALSRRTGVALLAVTDAQILEWFSVRGAVPRFVYDWQDQYSGLATGPGGAVPRAFLPATVQILVYPAGTWVKAVQDVVQLDTIYDSTLLATNEYTALMVEDGWAALKMMPLSRLYTVPVDPSGVTGCCPTLVS